MCGCFQHPKEKTPSKLLPIMPERILERKLEGKPERMLDWHRKTSILLFKFFCNREVKSAKSFVQGLIVLPTPPLVMRRGGGGKSQKAHLVVQAATWALLERQATCTRLAYICWLSKEITAPVVADKTCDKKDMVALGTSSKLDGKASRIANSSW